ncbi:hydrophobin-domain-containing protein [Schizopora paradoxa]|uniref:Hydrophobin n=1 Tax=Schizopora paradoxa TaxID=27342 RepID=A0A0H2RCN5_9AGAM|nr:hydrophobin-domain-containing protein [Schizopora paradoxa]
MAQDQQFDFFEYAYKLESIQRELAPIFSQEMKLPYALIALAAPILAAAAPGGTPTTSTVTVTVTTTATATPLSQCAASAVQCCETTSTTSDPITSLLVGLLDIVIEGLNVPIGINCSPPTVVGAGSTSCNVEPLCCENNTFNGLIAIGCVPIIINL